MKKIGISGNIASGKSTVENIIKSLGYKVIDADFVCHELLENDYNVICAVKTLFDGHDVLDKNGKLSRRRIGEVVFSSDKFRRELENILHPYVIGKISDFFVKNRDDNIVFASVPLLFEAGMEGLFDKIIFVSADENIRLERLMKRNGFPLDEAMARISAQKAENDKIKQSDFVIFNNGNIDELFKQVQTLIKKL